MLNIEAQAILPSGVSIASALKEWGKDLGLKNLDRDGKNKQLPLVQRQTGAARPVQGRLTLASWQALGWPQLSVSGLLIKRCPHNFVLHE